MNGNACIHDESSLKKTTHDKLSKIHASGHVDKVITEVLSVLAVLSLFTIFFLINSPNKRHAAAITPATNVKNTPCK